MEHGHESGKLFTLVKNIGRPPLESASSGVPGTPFSTNPGAQLPCVHVGLTTASTGVRHCAATPLLPTHLEARAGVRRQLYAEADGPYSVSVRPVPVRLHVHVRAQHLPRARLELQPRLPGVVGGDGQLEVGAHAAQAKVVGVVLQVVGRLVVNGCAFGADCFRGGSLEVCFVGALGTRRRLGATCWRHMSARQSRVQVERGELALVCDKC